MGTTGYPPDVARVGEDVVDESVGKRVGDDVVGESVGDLVGDVDGDDVVGDFVGELRVGDNVGEIVGAIVGDDVVGEVVGDVESVSVGDELVMGDVVDVLTQSGSVTVQTHSTLTPLPVQLEVVPARGAHAMELPVGPACDGSVFLHPLPSLKRKLRTLPPCPVWHCLNL